MQVRDPIINELDEQFVLVRTSSGAEGYVQVRHVVRAPSSFPALTDASRGEGSKLPANAPAAATGGVSLPTKVSSVHFGEWRAVEERPTAGRYSAGCERLADINKYFKFHFSVSVSFCSYDPDSFVQFLNCFNICEQVLLQAGHSRYRRRRVFSFASRHRSCVQSQSLELLR